MNENIKSFCLAVITVCVFVMTLLQLLNTWDGSPQSATQSSGIVSSAPVNPVPEVPLQQETYSGPKTSVKFEEVDFNFGELKQGDVVTHTFVFTNTGNAPLVITDAHGSCGCTVPTYSKEPIAPGATSKMEVQFNSANKEGLQDKTVTITANTDPPQTVLSIHASVKKPE